MDTIHVTESKYLVFRILERKPKTNVYAVYSKMHGFVIGLVKWYGNWRQYCFFPEPDTVFNKICLKDICKFIESLR